MILTWRSTCSNFEALILTISPENKFHVSQVIVVVSFSFEQRHWSRGWVLHLRKCFSILAVLSLLYHQPVKWHCSSCTSSLLHLLAWWNASRQSWIQVVQTFQLQLMIAVASEQIATEKKRTFKESRAVGLRPITYCCKSLALQCQVVLYCNKSWWIMCAWILYIYTYDLDLVAAYAACVHNHHEELISSIKIIQVGQPTCKVRKEKTPNLPIILWEARVTQIPDPTLIFTSSPSHLSVAWQILKPQRLFNPVMQG